MRKKTFLAIIAFICLSSFVVLGSSPRLVNKLLETVQNNPITRIFSSEVQTEFEKSTIESTEKVKKSEVFRQEISAITNGNQTREVPLAVLWRVIFSFPEKLEKAAEKARQAGQDDSLWTDYFVRQGGLSPENNQILKEIAKQHKVEVEAINEKAKVFIEQFRQQNPKPQSMTPPTELVELQEQKDEVTSRYRDNFKNAIGEETFAKFEKWVQEDFSKGFEWQTDSLLKDRKPDYDETSNNGFTSFNEVPQRKIKVADENTKQTRIERLGYYELYVYGYSQILYRDQSPALVSGLAGTELIFFGYPDWNYEDYDPGVHSLLYRVGGELLSEGSVTGYRDIIPAEGRHPTFFALAQNQYCVLSDHGFVYYYRIEFVWYSERVVLFYTQDCYTFPALPTPTPTPPCQPFGNGSLPPCPTPTPTPTPTPVVTSVTFSQVQASTLPISDNPVVSPHNPGIGRRIFPDDDVPQDPVDRRLVRVTATLSQPIPNVLVYFRNFDLDDPATDPIIDPLGNAGDDNNGMPRAGTLSMCSATTSGCSASTNASGVATVEFTVTRQPGDNFAIAAGVIPTEVSAVNMNGIELTNGSGQNIPTTCNTQLVCRSQMLTVWRRLHIEVDSMGASTGNFVLGNIATGLEIRRFQEVRLDVNTTNALEENRFENGRMTIGSYSLLVSNNTANTVTASYEGYKSVIFIPSGSLFTLYDDDDFNDDDGLPSSDGTLDGDTGEDIDREPDTALLTANSDIESSNVFAPAYVRPVYDVVDPNDNRVFQANTDGNGADDIRPLFVDRDLRNTNLDVEFWTVFLLGSYQHTVDQDGDPSTEDLVLGIVDAVTLVSDDFEGSGALIFTEGHRPTEFPGYTSDPTNLRSMAVTVAHETAHLFSCIHGDGGIMGTNPRTGTPVSNQYSPLMIRKIRVLMHP